MVIKVQGEQPFQILSTSFSISASESGYDLYFSADGVNYTQLFTVGANVNRQVTQVAAGSYYKLVGNTGNVVVNWYGNCVVDNGGGGGQYVLPVASQSTLGGVKIGSGITIDSGGTISVQGGGGKTPIILEEHYGDPTWTAIYNGIAASAVSMGVEEFAKNYDIYIKKVDDWENPYALYQAVGYAMQEGSDWDEDLQEDVQTTWLTFYTFENGGYTYWLLSTGSRGLGAITGFYPDSVAHPKSAWINIDTSGNVIDYNIEKVDEGLAQYNDNGIDYAFSMYLVCTPGDAERYRGNLQNFYKSYSGVSGDFFFRFVIDIEGTEYEAEYYWDQANQQIVKIVFQPYKTYLQSILNS